MGVEAKSIDKMSPADQINKLARRHIEIVFNNKTVKGSPAISFDQQQNAAGKHTLTFGPAAAAEIERAYGVLDGRHYIKNYLGSAMAHFDDYLEGKGVATSKDVCKVILRSEAERQQAFEASRAEAKKKAATTAAPV